MMATEMTDITGMVEYCIDNQEVLTEWETSFIGSIAEWIADGRSLSPKQVSCIASIKERVDQRRK